jgi:mannitol/fructose-specific phosphotransferase system IIA component (Ntr-type)
VGLADFLSCAIILEEAVVASRDQAIEAIVAELAGTGGIPRHIAPEIREAIIRREELGPTGIGEGVAIPHAWHPALERAVGALAVGRRGLVFESLDRKPVHIVALVLTPAGAEGERAKTAAFDAILRKMRDSDFRCRLLQAATRDELMAILREGGAS